MSKILHIVPGAADQWNGMVVAAKLLANESDAKVIDARQVVGRMVSECDEVWVHSTWSWPVWRGCLLALLARKKLVRMPHGNLDPVRLKYHPVRKWLVGSIERFFLRRADVIVATCEDEKNWVQKYEPRVRKIRIVDLKRYFKLERQGAPSLQRDDNLLHILFLGRRHPLKGIVYLEKALMALRGVELRIVSTAFGEEKDKNWGWCDVLVLPTLSENFGLVIAEALERGKCVITTDGAPAWGDGNNYGGRLVYLRGYRKGSTEDRVRLLKESILNLKSNLER